MKHTFFSCLIAFFSCANAGFAEDVQPSMWPGCPVLSTCLGKPVEMNILEISLGLTPEQKKSIADLAVSEKKDCPDWIAKHDALLKDPTKTFEQKESAIRAIPLNAKMKDVLKKQQEQVEKTLKPGQVELFKTWINEQWSLNLGRKVQTKLGVESLMQFLSGKLTLQPAAQNRIKQSWSYYKTIELTHRRKFLDNPQLDPAADLNYLKMVRGQADSAPLQMLDESQLKIYKSLMGVR